MTEEIQVEPDLRRLERLLEFAREEHPAEGVADASWAALSSRLESGGGSASLDAGAAGRVGVARLTIIGVSSLCVAAALVGALRDRPGEIRQHEDVSTVDKVESTVVGQGRPEVEQPRDLNNSSVEVEDDRVQDRDHSEPTLAPVTTPAAAPRVAGRDAGAKVEESSAKKSKAPAKSAKVAAAPSSCPDLAAEAQLLAQIQAELSGGRASAALEVVARWRRECTAAQLREEVHAVEILASCAAGQDAQAQAKAARFMARWPSSTFESRLANSCVGPTLAARAD